MITLEMWTKCFFLVINDGPLSEHQKHCSVSSHMRGFNEGFVSYTGDTFHTAWRSKQNRLSTRQKPARRYKCSVSKLPFDHTIIIILHLIQSSVWYSPHLQMHNIIFITEWLFFPAANTDQQSSPSAVNRPQRSNSLHLFARKVS